MSVLASCFGQAHGQSSEVPAATANPAPAGSKGIEEVVVTAQRRTEKLRDVPLSVTALTGAQLAQQGVASTADLTQVVPGLKIDQVGAYTSPAIRGISTQLTNPGTDANVAIYVDGVYQPNQAANSFDLPDVSRIEVLKGPQGTLFGRNATGGAIQIFTRDPSFVPTGTVSATYGSFNERQFKGFVSGPLITDLLAGSISGYYDKNDGYIHDIVSGKTVGGTQSVGVRGKLLAKLSDEAKVVLTFFYNKRKDQSDLVGIALNGNSIDEGQPGAVVATKPYDAAFNAEPLNAVESYGGSLRGTLDTSLGVFTTTLAGVAINNHIDADADQGYTPAGGVTYLLNTPDTTYSGELNFASRQFGALSFITGLYAYYDYSGYNPISVTQNLLIPGPTTYAVSIFGFQKDVSYAGYFEGNYDITDKLTVIAGMRYNYEQRTLTGTAGYGLITERPGPLLNYGQHDWASATPRVSVRYKVTAATNIYFTYSEGFKSGAYQPSSIPFAPPPAQAAPPVNPESVNAYEVGLKSTLFNRVSLSAAAFYYDYRNQQVNVYEYVNGVPFSVLANAASAHIFGGELDSSVHWTDEFTTETGLSILNARYSAFPAATIDVPSGYGGNLQEAINATGYTLVRSPDWTLTAAANYRKTFERGTLNLTANLYHSDRFFFDVGDRLQQPAYTTLGARASWAFGQTGVKVTAWGKNLTNAKILEGTFASPSSDAESFQPGISGGVTLDYSF